MPDSTPNWFDQGGDAYARYRPDYPDDLARFLGGIAPDRRIALDVGCGTGQFTRQLASQFQEVIGVDPSADQIAHASPHAGVRYAVAPAERLGLTDHRMDLVTAAQAAHWFDLPRFYAEVRRVAVPGAVLALVSYGVAELEPELRARFLAFYTDEIGPFWPPERQLVDSGYAAMDFPFREQAAPRLDIVRHWSAPEFLGYVSTWSAVRRAKEAGRTGLLTTFARDLLDLWGDPDRQRPIRWPIHMRLGIVP